MVSHEAVNLLRIKSKVRHFPDDYIAELLKAMPMQSRVIFTFPDKVVDIYGGTSAGQIDDAFLLLDLRRHVDLTRVLPWTLHNETHTGSRAQRVIVILHLPQFFTLGLEAVH